MELLHIVSVLTLGVICFVEYTLQGVTIHSKNCDIQAGKRMFPEKYWCILLSEVRLQFFFFFLKFDTKIFMPKTTAKIEVIVPLGW